MLKELKKYLKNERKDSTIFDIIVYGSSVKGKLISNDVDIAVIFKEGSLKERLSKIQEIKKKINIQKVIDIKGLLWEELFQKEFFGRSGIFLEGISLFDDKLFSSKIGFKGEVIFIYNMIDKTHTQKVKFNYILSGRNEKGIVKKLEGIRLAPGVVQIPTKYSLEFESVLKMNNINYFTKKVLIEL